MRHQVRRKIDKLNFSGLKSRRTEQKKLFATFAKTSSIIKQNSGKLFSSIRGCREGCKLSIISSTMTYEKTQKVTFCIAFLLLFPSFLVVAYEIERNLCSDTRMCVPYLFFPSSREKRFNSFVDQLELASNPTFSNIKNHKLVAQ